MALNEIEVDVTKMQESGIREQEEGVRPPVIQQPVVPKPQVPEAPVQPSIEFTSIFETKSPTSALSPALSREDNSLS